MSSLRSPAGCASAKAPSIAPEILGTASIWFLSNAIGVSAAVGICAAEINPSSIVGIALLVKAF